MKCFLAVNQLNNPIFLDFDADFTKFIQKKAVELGLTDGSENTDSAEVDTAVVTQLFSPLVLSQVPLDDQVHNPCTSIVCPNGLLLVFKKVDDIQYIAISGDEKDTADFLQRKILVFIRMTKFLFGPVYMEIANCSAAERSARWSFLKGVLRTWTHLASTDHSFLVEALERLHVNQLVSEKCVGLLERSVHSMHHDQPTQHAFLLVNTKLLALYSKRNSFELQPADILLTTLLAKDMFPSRNGLKDLFTPTPSLPDQKRKESGATDPPDWSEDNMETPSSPPASSGREERSDENEEFHSANTTPSPTPGNNDDDTQHHPLKRQLTDVTLATDSSTATLTIRNLLSNASSTLTDSELHHSSAAHGDDSKAAGQAADERERGGGDGGAQDGESDGGLERLMMMPAMLVKKMTGHKGSSSSGHKDSTSSSAVDAEYPMLSPGEGSALTTALLSGRISASDRGTRSRGNSTDAKHSDSSQRTPSDHSTPSSELGSVTTGSRSRSGTQRSSQSNQTQAGMLTDYWPHTVFLHTSSCHHAPHTLHCAQILPGITVVVVSQMPGYSAADPLCQVLSIVQDLLQNRRNKLSRSQGLHVHSVITDLLSKVHQVARKVKQKRTSSSSADVLTRWESPEMRERVVKFLLQEEEKPMSPDLESALMELQRRLKDLFQLLFVVPGRLGGREGEEVREMGKEVISKMKVKLQKELMDYRDYLSIKAQRNITMTSYLDDFPGLIHFIYVDRQFHQMTAPSFNTMVEQGKQDATLFLKEKIWTMYGYMMNKLKQGYTSVLLREGDFYFSFFLWFEDRMGNPVAVQEPYKPSLDTHTPGTLTGHFYKRLLRQCFPNRVDGAVHCYEMFLMHVGLVTPQYIAAHCQKLALKLWEMSGEAFTPVNLL